MKDVPWFLAMCFGLTYALHAILYLLGGLSSWTALPILLTTMFIPLTSAAVTIKRRLRLTLRDFGLRKARTRYYLYALLYPLLALALGILFVAVLGTAEIASNLGEFKRNLLTVPFAKLQPEFPLRPEELPAEVANTMFYVILFFLPIAPFMNAIPALGEEYGWRGFLLKRLTSRYGLTVGLAATGVVWGLWHAPLILMGYNYPSYPNLVGVSVFTIWAVLAGIFIGWLRVKSGSVYPAALAHGAMNAYLGVGLIIAPSHNELLTVPMGFPGLLALALIAALAYIDLGRSSTLSREFA